MSIAPATLDPATLDKARTIAAYLRKSAPTQAPAHANDVASWGEANFYIPQDDGRPRPIKLYPHQKTILKLFFDARVAQHFNLTNFQTVVYSTIKKSGKTCIAAMVARWLAETAGPHLEVYALANDLEQARGRIYQAVINSIELDPRYRRADKGILGYWRIIERQATHIPSNSTLRAVSSDYKGEAGSNPVATLWSELWGYDSEDSIRLYEELTPVPTRQRSIRYIETYAGYENESSILNDLEDRIKRDGYRLTHQDLSSLNLEWPYPDQAPPFYVHIPSRTFAYWDTGLEARRMPWQTQEYYQAQASELRENAFRRLHLNERVSSAEEFVPREWWDRLSLARTNAADPHNPGEASGLAVIKPPPTDTPMVVGADASVTGDCTALVAVIRDPNNPNNVIQCLSRIWQPTQGHPLDYSQTIEPTLREWCQAYNVVQIAYDAYQLHHLMTNLRNDAVAWCRPFGQTADRSIADKQLYDLIRDRRIRHTGDPVLGDHIASCAAKVPKDDTTRMRLIKSGPRSKIDGAVALSMACYECLRLNL